MSARAAWWIGLLAGAAVTVATLVEPPAGLSAPAGAVAVVGQRVIGADELAQAVAALAADRRDGAQPGDRARALDRLIDEALLVDWAIEAGLHRDDPRVRLDLATAALAAVAAEAEATPDDAELAAFLAVHAERFRAPRALTVDHRVFVGADGRARAERFAAGAEVPSDGHPLRLPRRPVGRADLERHLGPSRARALWDGAAMIGPWPVDDGWAVARRIADEGGEVPPLDAIRPLVREAWLRDRGERALRRFLDERAQRVPIWRAE